MSETNTTARAVLVVYAVGSVAVSIPLLLGLTHTGDLANTTSGKILVAALLAMGMGAALAVRDPWRNRIVVQILIAFTALSAVAIAYRVAFEHKAYDPSWMLLILAIAASVALTVFYPRPPSD
jgi:hypothetical protein